ncbi:hypothetical protein GVN16_08045 [Emticicia sp. CRIBPO]|uniref:hypothetical protein n=1 Tax=Emticicia sp. CRIBPO TaxID=2683258 RepID=UPI001411F6BB|nr:hypothetical protein [Emticicia sp. CRIBPO]NBA85705.1 hypothetical protein [Emticicia sp. CRIBPO]
MPKKLPFFVIICFCFNSVYAQLDFKINAFGLANKKIEASVEAGHDKLGLELTLGYSYKPWADGVSVNEEDVSIKRSGILLGFRPNFYVKPKTTLNGFYVSPYTYYRRLVLKFEEPSVHNRATAGLILGLKGRIYDDFSFHTEAGLGYNFIYKYHNKVTGEKENWEESIPIFGNLTKIDIPIRVSVIYRIGER